MEELIARLAAAGIDAGPAKEAVAIILRFLKREGPPAETAALLDKVPGAAAAAEGGGAGGMFGGGLFAVFNELTATGLGMGDIQTVAKTTLAFAEEKAGRPAVEAVVGKISGLSQFL